LGLPPPQTRAPKDVSFGILLGRAETEAHLLFPLAGLRLAKLPQTPRWEHSRPLGIFAVLRSTPAFPLPLKAPVTLRQREIPTGVRCSDLSGGLQFQTPGRPPIPPAGADSVWEQFVWSVFRSFSASAHLCIGCPLSPSLARLHQGACVVPSEDYSHGPP